jgi:hypothetical protein
MAENCVLFRIEEKDVSSLGIPGRLRRRSRKVLASVPGALESWIHATTASWRIRARTTGLWDQALVGPDQM